MILVSSYNKIGRFAASFRRVSGLALPLGFVGMLLPLAGCGGGHIGSSVTDRTGEGAAVSRGTQIQAPPITWLTSFAYSSPDPTTKVSQIWTVPAAGGTATQITFGGTAKYAPSWSPDRKMIAFHSPDPTSGTGFGGDMGCQIYVISATAPAGTKPTKLTSGDAYKYNPKWSPDGTKLVYSGQDTAGVYQIWTIPAVGGAPTQITRGGYSKSFPSWSPDGKQIAYSDTNHYLYTMPATGGTSSIVFSGVSPAFGQAPVWSPDGTTLAFFQSDGIPDYARDEIYTVPAKGGTIKQLTFNGAYGNSHYPSWAPDGSAIVFTGLGQIRTIPAKGGTATLVNTNTSSNDYPAWSPL